MKNKIPKVLFLHPLFQQVKKTLSEMNLPLPRKDEISTPLLVALSGGADSVALLRLLLLMGFDCKAIHCNFHLRGEASNQDACFVEELCTRLQVPLRMKQFDTMAYAEEKQISLEMAARDLRYHYFQEVVVQSGIPHVALGHHLGDNIETLVQHLAEGAGILGIRGIPPQRDCFIRPMIDCREADIYDFLSLIEQPYCVDATNADTTIQRNFIRHQLVPLFARLNPSYELAFRRTFQNVRETIPLVEYAVEHLISEVTLDAEKGIYDARKIAESPAPLTLLYTLFSSAGFSRKRLELFLQTLSRPDPATIQSPTHQLERRGFKLTLTTLSSGEEKRDEAR